METSLRHRLAPSGLYVMVRLFGISAETVVTNEETGGSSTQKVELLASQEL